MDLKLKIYSFQFNRPDFIPLQYKSIKRFVGDNSEFIVINNGQTPTMKAQIEAQCNILGVKYYNVEPQLPYSSSPSVSHGMLLQWTFDHIAIHDKNCISCFMDADMFFINKPNFIKDMYKYDVAGVPFSNQHINYLWPNLLFMNIDRLPNKSDMNFMCGYIDGLYVDTGGFLYYWMKNNNNLKVKDISNFHVIESTRNNLHRLPADIRKNYLDEFEFHIIENMILHYSHGSNWNNMDDGYHVRKTELIILFVEGCINGNIMLTDD